jgi:hypothetical protein
MKPSRQFIGVVALTLSVPLLFLGITKAEKGTQNPARSSFQPSANQLTQHQMTTESDLRGVIENLKSESPDYFNMEPKLRIILREQKTAATDLLNKLGSIEAIEFIENDSGFDVYLVWFQHGSTIWEFGKSARGRISVLDWDVLQDSTLKNLPISFI